MKSYTWTYDDSVTVRFTDHRAMIRQTGQKGLVVKFSQPNGERLGLYNAKLVADCMKVLGYDFGGRVITGIKSMRENVPFPAVLSEIEARREIPSASRTLNGSYLIQIPLAQDYQRVIDFMRENEIKWL